MPLKAQTGQSMQDEFSIIAEFETLSYKSKVLLCDQLLQEGEDVFSGTVRMMWPQAKTQDVQKLEKFLILLQRSGRIGQETIH